MEASTQDISAIIADEIAEYNKGKRSTSISSEVEVARFEGLVQIVAAVMTALQRAEMGGVDPALPRNVHLNKVFSFRAHPYADFRLVVQVETDGLKFFRLTGPWGQSSPLDVITDLFWDSHHKRWFGPRLKRDLSKAGAPWTRESAEAVVTRAILAAYDLAARKDP